ncbi:MAG: UbiX family flavin prenyltransferase [Candidatus Altiarchaeota archaeon]
MKLIIAITGASGIILGQRLLEELRGHETHLIMTSAAEDVARFEENKSPKEIRKLASRSYDEDNLMAKIASSSYKVDGMVIVPCSMKTLSGVANGYSDNLVTRAAENMLKMGWKLIVVPRETPLTLAAIENMRKLKMGGAIILPPEVAYYHKPETADDMSAFIVGKILDVLGIEHKLYRKWEGK